MPKTSHGILVFKIEEDQIYVLLAHPGGPIWSNKDFWSVPKGEEEAGEDGVSTARREFSEETGLPVPDGTLIDLGDIHQSSVKINHIWAVSANPDISGFSSNSFSMEWPPHSGSLQHFPEVDKIQWFDLASAKSKLFNNQKEVILRLERALKE